jgi:hypothetical protein
MRPLGNLAFTMGHNFLPQFFSVAVMLAGIAGVFWLRPPQTIGPQPIWQSGDPRVD